MYNKLEGKQWLVAGLSALVMTQGQTFQKVVVKDRRLETESK
jgi:hypothetical protein